MNFIKLCISLQVAHVNMYIKTNGLFLQYIYRYLYSPKYVESEENSDYRSIMFV